MSKSKSTSARRPARHSPVNNTERDERLIKQLVAVQAIAARQAASRAKARPLVKFTDQPQLRETYFCDDDRKLPIAGTPAPAGCPFCGCADEVFIAFTEHEAPGQARYATAQACCRVCGACAPEVSSRDEGIETNYGLVMEAAAQWNRRSAQRRSHEKERSIEGTRP